MGGAQKNFILNVNDEKISETDMKSTKKKVILSTSGESINITCVNNPVGKLKKP